MAERRMFAKTIIDSDAFLDMPLSTQALYFHLSMRADDDGFINNPKKIMRMIGASQNEMELLFSKKFILAFESGVVVIKHWRVHNYIQKDRYKPTLYTEEMEMLTVKDNDGYTMDTICMQDVSTGQDSIGKDSIGNSKRERFHAPSIEEIETYCKENNYNIDAEYFFNYYESVGWKRGKTPMKSWKGTIANWAKKEKEKDKTPEKRPKTSSEIIEEYNRRYGKPEIC